MEEQTFSTVGLVEQAHSTLKGINNIPAIVWFTIVDFLCRFLFCWNKAHVETVAYSHLFVNKSKIYIILEQYSRKLKSPL